MTDRNGKQTQQSHVRPALQCLLQVPRVKRSVFPDRFFKQRNAGCIPQTQQGQRCLFAMWPLTNNPAQKQPHLVAPVMAQAAHKNASPGRVQKPPAHVQHKVRHQRVLLPSKPPYPAFCENRLVRIRCLPHCLLQPLGQPAYPAPRRMPRQFSRVRKDGCFRRSAMNNFGNKAESAIAAKTEQRWHQAKKFFFYLSTVKNCRIKRRLPSQRSGRPDRLDSYGRRNIWRIKQTTQHVRAPLLHQRNQQAIRPEHGLFGRQPIDDKNERHELVVFDEREHFAHRQASGIKQCPRSHRSYWPRGVLLQQKVQQALRFAPARRQARCKNVRNELKAFYLVATGQYVANPAPQRIFVQAQALQIKLSIGELQCGCFQRGQYRKASSRHSTEPFPASLRSALGLPADVPARRCHVATSPVAPSPIGLFHGQAIARPALA